MQALVWDGSQARVVDDHPRPEADAEHALVAVRLAGICSTDLHILRGYMGFTGVLGHELVGEVMAGPPEWLGRRVTCEINFACGACPSCARGLGRHCPTRQVMGILGADGCFAELLRAPLANLHPVPPEVSDEAAVFAEPLAAAFEVLEQVHVSPGARALVLGDGKLGLLVAQVLQLTGAEVSVAGRHPAKMAFLAGRGIAALEPGGRPLPTDCDLVVEATGSAAGLSAALEAIRPRGTLVLKSTIAGEHRLSLAPLVIQELTVVGSRCGPFPPALQALAQERVSVAPLVEEVFPLARAAEALQRAATPGVRKVLLRPD